MIHKNSDEYPHPADNSAEDGEISPLELNQLMATADQNLLLIDVRESWEWELVRLPGALHIPLSQLREQWPKTVDHQTKMIVVYCHHGMRSNHAMQVLCSLGVKKVKSLRGGIHSWSLEIDPSLARY